MDFSYLVSTVAWIAVGFASGWVTGEVVRTRRVLRGVAPVVKPKMSVSRVRVWLEKVPWLTVLGVLILLMVAVVFIRTEAQISDERAFVTCQQRQNDRFADQLNRRTGDANSSDLAQIELLSTQPGDPAAGRAALAKYLDALRNQLAQRAEHPLVSGECLSP